MVQSLQRGSRVGWQIDEQDRLFAAVREAANEGTPLKGVFERVGQDLGRKPNSIRNYYYQAMREKPENRLQRAAPFEVFTQEEVHNLLRQVLTLRGEGLSVRAAVMRIANGDRCLMLRYQNKYRTIMKSKPHMIEAVRAELSAEGVPVPQSTAPRAAQENAAPKSQTEMMVKEIADPAINMMMEGINALLYRAVQNRHSDKLVELDRLQVKFDLSRMAWENEEKQLKEALMDMMAMCRDLLALPLKQRIAQLPTFSTDAAMALSHGEALLTRLNGFDNGLKG